MALNKAESQLLFNPLPLTPDESKISFGTNKIQSVYNFNSTILTGVNSDYGNIILFQDYSGQGNEISSGVSYLENNNLQFQYSKQFIDKISFINRYNWFINSNTINFGMNKLERANINLGLRYNYDSSSYIESTYGFERNTSIGVEEFGNLFKFNIIQDRYKLDDTDIYGDFFFENLKLYDDRQNRDIILNLNTISSIDQFNKFEFGINFKNQARDNLEINPSIEMIPVRSRNQNELSFFSNIYYNPFDFLTLTTYINYANRAIQNSYNNYFSQVQFSGILRNIKGYDLNINNSFIFDFRNHNINFMVNYIRREEDFSIQNRFNIPDAEFTSLRIDQNKQDLSSSYLELNLKTNFKLSSRDTLNFNTFISIFRYDTPSNQNNDDRDELSYFGRIEYLKRMSNIFRIGIFTEFRNLHLVYLRSDRSALNNWNRILKLGISSEVISKILFYRPSLSINANYTIYDFQESVSGINSFSFREINYIDSLKININNNFKIGIKNSIRYNERGILFWDKFAERPERANLELYSNVLLIREFDNNFFAAGIRYFKRSDKRLDLLPNMNNIINSFESIAPEIKFHYTFSSGNSLEMDFWYEFQTTNNLKREIPNFYLIANIVI